MLHLYVLQKCLLHPSFLSLLFLLYEHFVSFGFFLFYECVCLFSFDWSLVRDSSFSVEWTHANDHKPTQKEARIASTAETGWLRPVTTKTTNRMNGYVNVPLSTSCFDLEKMEWVMWRVGWTLVVLWDANECKQGREARQREL